MKYVIMFTSTPELDAAVSPERARAGLRRIYEWFGEHADQHHRLRRRAAAGRPPRPRSSTAAAARSSPTGRSPRRRRSSAASASSTSPTSTRRSRWSRRGRCSSCPATPSRSARWSWTTANGAVSETDAAAPATPDGPGPRHPIASSPRVRARGVGADRRGAHRLARQPRPRRGGGRRGDRGGAAGMAHARRAAEPRRMAHAGGPAQRARPAPPREALPRQARAARRARRLRPPRLRTSPTSGSRCCSDAAIPRSRPTRSSR